MIDRINLILKAKNITARQFAEEIGVQPSGMSHILSGRNRPSLDFIMKVVNRYPEIDIKWLMFGEGQMYAPTYPVPGMQSYQPHVDAERSHVAPVVERQPEKEQIANTADLFTGQASLFEDELSDKDSSAPMAQEDIPQELAAKVQEKSPEPVTIPQRDENRVNESRQPVVHEYSNVGNKRIVKVVILYEDHSFSEYYPE